MRIPSDSHSVRPSSLCCARSPRRPPRPRRATSSPRWPWRARRRPGRRIPMEHSSPWRSTRPAAWPSARPWAAASPTRACGSTPEPDRSCASAGAERLRRCGLSGGAATQGLFLASGAAPVALAFEGDAAPDTGGGTFLDFLYPAINGSSDRVFLSNVRGGSATGGLFVASPALAAVAVEDPVVTGAGPIQQVGLPDIDDQGRVTVSMGFASGPVASGVFVHASGSFSPVVLDGETAPGAGGALFQSLRQRGRAGGLRRDAGRRPYRSLPRHARGAEGSDAAAGSAGALRARAGGSRAAPSARRGRLRIPSPTGAGYPRHR